MLLRIKIGFNEKDDIITLYRYWIFRKLQYLNGYDIKYMLLLQTRFSLRPFANMCCAIWSTNESMQTATFLVSLM